MSICALDLVVERIVLDGINLPPDQAPTLARLVEDELRLLISGGGLRDGGDVLITDVKPIALSQPTDVAALAKMLARRIAAKAQQAKVDYER